MTFPCENHAQATEDESSELNGSTASKSTQIAYHFGSFPTPEPKDWQVIELVAARACAALDWALAPTALANITSENVGKLTQRLCELLELLVLGHLQDLDLDVCTLFKAALKPVLGALRAGHEEYTGLAGLMLTRLGDDCRLVPQGMADAAPEIIRMFCESHGQSLRP